MASTISSHRGETQTLGNKVPEWKVVNFCGDAHKIHTATGQQKAKANAEICFGQKWWCRGWGVGGKILELLRCVQRGEDNDSTGCLTLSENTWKCTENRTVDCNNTDQNGVHCGGSEKSQNATQIPRSKKILNRFIRARTIWYHGKSRCCNQDRSITLY